MATIKIKYVDDDFTLGFILDKIGLDIWFAYWHLSWWWGLE